MRRIGIISKVGFANLELRQIDNDKYEFAKWWKGADGKEKSSKGFIISATAYDELKKNIDKEDVILETNEQGEVLKWSYMDRLNNGLMKYELRYWKDGNDLNNGLTFLPVEKEKLKEILANPLDEEIEVEQPKAEEKPKPEEQPKTEEKPIEEVKPKIEEQPKANEEFNVIDVLVTVPESDINFKTALEKATMTQVNLAIIRLKARKGNHKTKLKILNDKLKKKSVTVPNSESKSKTVSKPKSVAAKPKDVKKLDESKRIKLEPYQATGNHTYEECEKS